MSGRWIAAWMALVGCGRLDFGPRGDAGTPTTDAADPSPVVPGGTFLRSYDVSGDGQFQDTGNPATVSRFRLDRYAVTVGRFRAFVAAGGGTQQGPPLSGAGAHPNLPGSGWDATWTASLVADTPTLIVALDGCNGLHTWTDAPGGNEDRPLNCVTWFELMAFCVWDGGYLPTDAEWNFAAAAGDQQRAFPWSNPPGSLAVDPSDASYNLDGMQDCGGDAMPGCAVSDLSPVGSHPAGDGAFGQSDLGGNVYDWLLDQSTGTAFVNPCVDCASLVASSDRYARGGSYRDTAGNMRVGVRSAFDATVRADVFGGRCARPP